MRMRRRLFSTEEEGRASEQEQREPMRRRAEHQRAAFASIALDGGFFVMAEEHREGTSMGGMTLDGVFFPPRRRPLRKDGMTLG